MTFWKLIAMNQNLNPMAMLTVTMKKNNYSIKVINGSVQKMPQRISRLQGGLRKKSHKKQNENF